MPTAGAFLLRVLRPMQLTAAALLTEITGKRLHLEETQKGEELSNAVLDRSSG